MEHVHWGYLKKVSTLILVNELINIIKKSINEYLKDENYHGYLLFLNINKVTKIMQKLMKSKLKFVYKSAAWAKTIIPSSASF